MIRCGALLHQSSTLITFGDAAALAALDLLINTKGAGLAAT
jgi:hypothetical protein